MLVTLLLVQLFCLFDGKLGSSFYYKVVLFVINCDCCVGGIFVSDAGGILVLDGIG